MYYRFESIKQLRKNLKKTQEEMSDMLGMSARNYREKECGKLPFSQLEIMKINKIFNLEKEELFQMFIVNGFNTIFWLNDSLKNKNF